MKHYPSIESGSLLTARLVAADLRGRSSIRFYLSRQVPQRRQEQQQQRSRGSSNAKRNEEYERKREGSGGGIEWERKRGNEWRRSSRDWLCLVNLSRSTSLSTICSKAYVPPATSATLSPCRSSAAELLSFECSRIFKRLVWVNAPAHIHSYVSGFMYEYNALDMRRGTYSRASPERGERERQMRKSKSQQREGEREREKRFLNAALYFGTN